MAHTSPKKRLDKVAGFIRLAVRQIQENDTSLALRTLNNAASEIGILIKDPKSEEL